MAKEDKIQQILICAKELFGLYGYDKVSMRDIADRAGISVGNLTYYYGRKERIMLAVLDQINEEVSRPADIPGTAVRKMGRNGKKFDLLTVEIISIID